MLVSSCQRMIFSTEEAAAAAAAEIIMRTVKARPNVVLGLATGVTMEPVYAKLVSAFEQGDVSFADITAFNLDEYAGLPASHPSSYRSTMNTLFFDHVDIDKSRTYLPETLSERQEEAGLHYEQMIADAGGIDLQLLGIGRNGHIGFNEPGSHKDSRTRLVGLHKETLEANSRFFTDRPVPVSAVTMGVGTILAAREIVVLATGQAKADAVYRANSGRFDPACPASALQDHARVTWVMDSAAAMGKIAA